MDLSSVVSSSAACSKVKGRHTLLASDVVFSAFLAPDRWTDSILEAVWLGVDVPKKLPDSFSVQELFGLLALHVVALRPWFLSALILRCVGRIFCLGMANLRCSAAAVSLEADRRQKFVVASSGEPDRTQVAAEIV